MAKKILFASHKGGAGKTTSAVNIAAALALAGKRVLLVDLDQQGNSSEALTGIEASELPVSLNDLFQRPDLAPGNAILPSKFKNLHLIAGHPDLASTESGMVLQRADPSKPDPILALRGLLSGLGDHYDFMIFDTPPSIGFMTINALAASDELVIPVAAKAFGKGGVRITVEAYRRAVQTYNPGLRLRGILVTQLNTQTTASTHMNEIIGAEYGKLVFPQLIVQATATDEANQLSIPLVIRDPNSPAAIGYMKIAEILSK